jgi:hypothetical protein
METPMLETEIKKLTAAITRLADLMEQNQAEAQQPEPHTAQAKVASLDSETPVDENEREAETPEPTPVDENETPGYTTDDIKSMALAISRKDRSKQKDIKSKLAEYDAKVASDLEGDALQKVGEWLAALKDEVGA